MVPFLQILKIGLDVFIFEENECMVFGTWMNDISILSVECSSFNAL